MTVKLHEKSLKMKKKLYRPKENEEYKCKKSRLHATMHV
jgi:hypothetical protein